MYEVLENILTQVTQYSILILEIVGVVIIMATAVRCMIAGIKRNRTVPLKLGKGIALALEFKLGGEVLRRAGVSADLLRPLIAETTAKALAAARPAAVQTGPAVRGDLPTQERHLRLLADDALLSDIYRLITQSIWETSRKIS